MLVDSSDKETKLVSSPIPVESRLMLFDLATGGHHPCYIQHLLEYWYKESMPGKLFIVVSPEFLIKHADLTQLTSSSVEFVEISEEETDKLLQEKKVIHRFFFEWKLYCKYASILQVNYSLLMYFDHLQLPIVFGERSPCPFAGIYFRPSFHYKHFENYVPRLKDTWRGWRQKILLFLTLKNHQMDGLLTLDHYSVPYIKALSPKSKTIKHLPDPVATVPVDPQQVQDLKRSLGIEKGRKIFLLLGRLSERKGVFQVLEAVKLLTQDVAQKCCLLLVGEISENIKIKVLEHISDLRKESSVQIIIKGEYQTAEAIHFYVSAANVVLAPYQRHIGMSGVLMLSSAYKKPILCSDYGLLGELTRKYQLGISVDTSNSRHLSEGISMFFDNSISQFLKFKESPELFDDHSPQKFSSTIFTLISLCI